MCKLNSAIDSSIVQLKALDRAVSVQELSDRSRYYVALSLEMTLGYTHEACKEERRVSTLPVSHTTFRKNQHCFASSHIFHKDKTDV